MANSKISALPAASTPLAGTETLPIVQGGITEQVSVANLTAGRAVSAASLALTTSPLPVTSGGTGTATAFTAGSVVFAGASGVYSQKNANFFWDNTNNRLGVNTATPSNDLEVAGTIRTSSGANYALFANNFLRSYASGTFFFDNFTVGQSFVWRVSSASALDTTAMTMASTGNITVNTGNVVIGTSGKGIQGTTTNDNANAGVVGELISSSVAAAGVTLTTAVYANITSISLTAGDWDVAGVVGITSSTGTNTIAYANYGSSTTTGATGTLGQMGSLTTPSTIANTIDFVTPIPTTRYSLASTTTVYLVTRVSFGGVGTVSGYGVIRARRVR
jgi:hypothetical protein